MPTAPLRECSIPGCHRLTDYGRCQGHRKQRERDRGSSKERGYDATWRRLRKMKLAAQPLCAQCSEAGTITPAEEVHHEKPIRERPDLRLVLSNLVSLCKSCHSKITAQENGWTS